MYKKISLAVFFVLYLLLFLPQRANADLINPEWFSKKCAVGEKEVTCKYSSEKAFGPRTTDECKTYANNSNYYYLTGHESSFGGEEKYCLKEGAVEEVSAKKISNIYYFVGAGILTLSAIAVGAIFIIRKKNVRKSHK